MKQNLIPLTNIYSSASKFVQFFGNPSNLVLKHAMKSFCRVMAQVDHFFFELQMFGINHLCIIGHVKEIFRNGFMSNGTNCWWAEIGSCPLTAKILRVSKLFWCFCQIARHSTPSTLNGKSSSLGKCDRKRFCKLNIRDQVFR